MIYLHASLVGIPKSGFFKNAVCSAFATFTQATKREVLPPLLGIRGTIRSPTAKYTLLYAHISPPTNLNN